MWLLNAVSFRLEEYHGNRRPEYAILSHTWGDEEVSFLDIRDFRQHKLRGWTKIELCCKQAVVDGYDYVWADTCCIDKRNIVELSEALNSMFRWYKEAAICYTYLEDVDANIDETRSDLNDSNSPYFYQQTSGNITQHEHICQETLHDRDITEYLDRGNCLGSRVVASRWFSRGWTLQELVAPKSLVFYDTSWTMLGTRLDYVSEIESRTSIPQNALQEFVPGDYCIAQKMAWAAGRQTTRPEDRAYSMLGLLGASLSLIYGEGEEESFIRLQRKLIKRLDDTSILAWNRDLSTKYSHWLLAPSPDAFEGCHIFQEYQPCAYGLDLGKSALTGTFDVRFNCFDVEFACLGHFKSCLKSNLPKIHQNDCDWIMVDSIGMALLNLNNGSHQCAVLDNKHCTLFKRHTAHQHDDAARTDLSINPRAPSLSTYCYSSWQFHGSHYPVRGDEGVEIQICPAQFWELRPDMSPQILTPSARDAKPLILQPQERETRCFVICKPNVSQRGIVVIFRYGLNGRPALHGLQLSSVIPEAVLDNVIAYQTVEATHGKVEIGSRRFCDNFENRQASMFAALDWANSRAFDTLVLGDHDGAGSASLPLGSRVLQLGGNIKVVFLPQRDGYRAFFAFRGRYRGLYNFPRSWLWPQTEVKDIVPVAPQAPEVSMTKKFKRFFR